MGANCCVPARDKPLTCRTSIEASAHRNIRYSPSWSFRWDNRTHIEDIMDNPAHFSRHNSGHAGSENKSGADTDLEGLSDGGSPLDAFQTPRWQKSPIRTGTAGSSKTDAADPPVGSFSSSEEKDSVRSLSLASASDAKPSTSIPSTPSSLAFRTDPSSSRSHSLPSDPTSSRKARRSPGHQLARQVSDNRIPALRSLNENSSPEGGQSFVFSVCSNDHSNGGSQGGSSDGWSMRTFSELVASSQRERWSLDSENACFINSKAAKPNTRPSTSVSADLQSCGVCLKLLKDRTAWNAHKIANEIPVVAILVCGHVYHAECLETVTHETDRFDPSCPVCTLGEKCSSKLLGKADLKARNKISRIAVADIDIGGISVSEHCKRGNGPKIGMSSSMKSSFGRPFLRRHFSTGSSRSVRSVSESDSTRKKGFWARYRRD